MPFRHPTSHGNPRSRFGGQGVGFHEEPCVPESATECARRRELQSDYREESRVTANGNGTGNEAAAGPVGLREASGEVVWAWTTEGEWLLYTVEVGAACTERLG